MTYRLIEEIVDAAHFFSAEAHLMYLPEVISMFVAGYKTWVTAFFVAIHLIIIRDSDVVVAKSTIHAVVDLVGVVAAVCHATILTRVTMEITTFPPSGIDILIRIQKIIAMERNGLVEDVNGHKKVHREEKTNECDDDVQ